MNCEEYMEEAYRLMSLHELQPTPATEVSPVLVARVKLKFCWFAPGDCETSPSIGDSCFERE